MGRLRCDPGDWCPEHLWDCTICPRVLELYGPPPEPGAVPEEDEESDRDGRTA